MAKKKKCVVILHGIRREISAGSFESIKEAKEFVKNWDRPYTIKTIN
jgi:hypothetical protein